MFDFDAADVLIPLPAEGRHSCDGSSSVSKLNKKPFSKGGKKDVKFNSGFEILAFLSI